MKNTLEIYENFSYIKLVKLNKNSFSNETKIKNKIIKKIILSSKWRICAIEYLNLKLNILMWKIKQ